MGGRRPRKALSGRRETPRGQLWRRSGGRKRQKALARPLKWGYSAMIQNLNFVPPCGACNWPGGEAPGQLYKISDFVSLRVEAAATLSRAAASIAAAGWGSTEAEEGGGWLAGARGRPGSRLLDAGRGRARAAYGCGQPRARERWGYRGSTPQEAGARAPELRGGAAVGARRASRAEAASCAAAAAGAASLASPAAEPRRLRSIVPLGLWWSPPKGGRLRPPPLEIIDH